MSFLAALLLALARLREASAAQADENASSVTEKPVLEAPTLHCLGATWILRGDANRNARVDVMYRRGAENFKKGPPLFRVEKAASKIAVPQGATLFAGSVVGLHPDSSYELKFSLTDPDGGSVERIYVSRTLAEPAAPADLAVIDVRPGPRAIRDAQLKAKPGTVLLLHAGLYEGTVQLFVSGEPGRPMILKAAGDGEVIFDAKGESNAMTAGEIHDVWIEGITFRNAVKGITANNSARIVVRKCRFQGLSYGVVATVNEKDVVRGFFISDNVFEGPCTWPRTKGIESPRAVQLTGAGHVVCYNRIRGFADAVDTMPSGVCAAIDVHNNEISEMTDDGIEMDFSERNTRCFSNRLTNVFQGISAQPVHGGPVYIFRNVLYNVVLEPFKLHSRPSGVILYHNTVMKKGTPFLLMTEEPVRNCVSRNNLFVGSPETYACMLEAAMEQCDFDYDGFAGGPWAIFLKWHTRRFATPEEARARAPAYRNARVLATTDLFASGAKVPDDPDRTHPPVFDARLKAGVGAIDAGELLWGFNDGFGGTAPDLGAFESGAPAPRYGPRN